MEWYQALIISLVSVIVGAFLGYWFNRRGMKAERGERERKELHSAMRSLQVELHANIELMENPIKELILAPFSTDMWSAHKGKVNSLPSQLQQDVFQAYQWMGKANAVVQTHVAYAPSREYCQSVYFQWLDKMKESAIKARDELDEWLRGQK